MNSIAARKLKERMILADVSVQDVCRAAKISKPSFYRRMRGVSDFRQRDIAGIARLLKLTGDEVEDIFFSDEQNM